ncbi:glycoside hydrolase family 108 protein [Deinococcus pimensis]|uniref:glycoside hydrolase family 108 protein n=1 Tax=Deinococcus pimensis TaxID=309888 RepID=UPI0004B87CBD|nr:glycosyl hydrolase 108 family protein [Deinococcus pimensis]
MSLFDECLTLVLGHEGGYVNDPFDPGGETNWGISKRQYPNLNIRALTREDAARIYRRDYWDAMMCDTLPPGLALCTFDTAVNSGIGRAGQFLAGAGNAADFMAARLDFLTRLDTWPRFGKGWARRCAKVLQQASNLDRKYAPPPLPVEPSTPRRALLLDDGRGVWQDVTGQRVETANVVVNDTQAVTRVRVVTRR